MTARLLTVLLGAAFASSLLAAPADAGAGRCQPGYRERSVGGIQGCYSLSTGAVYFLNVPPTTEPAAVEGEEAADKAGEGTGAEEGGTPTEADETLPKGREAESRESGKPVRGVTIDVRR